MAKMTSIGIPVELGDNLRRIAKDKSVSLIELLADWARSDSNRLGLNPYGQDLADIAIEEDETGRFLIVDLFLNGTTIRSSASEWRIVAADLVKVAETGGAILHADLGMLEIGKRGVGVELQCGDRRRVLSTSLARKLASEILDAANA